MTDVHEFSVVRYRVARKARRCCECGAGIAVGERYQYIFGVYGGDVDSVSTCLDCGLVRDAFVDEIGGEPVPLGDLFEWISFEEREKRLIAAKARRAAFHVVK